MSKQDKIAIILGLGLNFAVASLVILTSINYLA